jgi:hypothetical protein
MSAPVVGQANVPKTNNAQPSLMDRFREWAGVSKDTTDKMKDWSVSSQDVSSTFHNLGQQAGMVGRGAVDAVTALPGLAANATMEGYNKLTGSNQPLPTDAMNQQLDKVVAPESKGEQLLRGAVSAAGGAKIPLGLPAAPAASGQLANSLAIARSAGYVVPKSSITGSVGALEQIVGPKALAAEATRQNISNLSDKLAEQFQLPPGTEITHSTMDAVRSKAGEAYDAIASLSPGYAQLVETIKELRNQAGKLYRQTSSQYNVATEKQADELWGQAKQADEVLAGALKQEGKSDLVDNYLEARKTIAQTHDVDKALINSRGEVNPQTFATSFGKERPQSGAILDAGRSGEAFKSAFTTGGGKALPSIDATLLGSGVGLNYIAPDHMKLALTAALAGAGRYGLRRLMLSGPVQDMALASPEQKRAALAESLLRSKMATGN